MLPADPMAIPAMAPPPNFFGVLGCVGPGLFCVTPPEVNAPMELGEPEDPDFDDEREEEEEEEFGVEVELDGWAMLVPNLT